MRTLILSDIHANLVALERVLETDDAKACEQIWCLGDVVGYGPNPNECVALMRERATHCLVGNHDWAALGQIEIADFNHEAQAAIRWTQEALSEDSRAFLGALEGRLDGVHPDFTLAHASPRHPIWEYLLEAETAAENFDQFETRYCLVGHTHKPLIFQKAPEHEEVRPFRPSPDQLLELNAIGDLRLIINPGSVGQPRDSDPRAAYLVYDDEAATLTFRRVAYDIAETQRRMAEAGLPRRLINRLEVGW